MNYRSLSVRTSLSLTLTASLAVAQGSPAGMPANDARCDLVFAARTAAAIQLPNVQGPLTLDPASLVVVRNRKHLDTDLARKLAATPGLALFWQRLEHTEQGLRLTPAQELRLQGAARQIDSEATCRARAERFARSVAGSSVATAWADLRLGAAREIFRPDVVGPAYYEFTVSPSGYVVVSTGEHDRPVTQWDAAGTPPSVVLTRNASAPVARIYKLDTLSYVAEDAAGNQVAQLNTLPDRLVPTADGNSWQRDAWQSWAQTKAEYRNTYLPLLESLRMDAAITWLAERAPAVGPADWSPWSYWYAGNTNEQCNYGQWTENGCAVGCGPVAWAMLIGWVDRRATWDWRWRNQWGIYRVNGGYGSDTLATTYQTYGIDQVIRELRSRLYTWCITGSGATWPWDMGRASGYLAYRSPGYVRTSYNAAGVADAGCSAMVESSIKYLGTPAIMGTGWLTHYPLGFIYAQRQQQVLWWTEYQKWVWVNQGWWGTGNTWVDGGSWFSGEILP